MFDHKGGETGKIPPPLPERTSLLLELTNKGKMQVAKRERGEIFAQWAALGSSGYLTFGVVGKPYSEGFLFVCFVFLKLS